MLDYIKLMLTKRSELKTFCKQNDGLIDFIERLGFSTISKVIGFDQLQDKYVNLDNGSFGIDYIKIIAVELITKREADFISINKAYYAITGLELPLPSDLLVNQYLVIRSYRRTGDILYHHYKVDFIKYGLLGAGSMPSHYMAYDGQWGKRFWLNGSIKKEGTFGILLSNYKKSIKECVIDLIRDINYYNLKLYGPYKGNAIALANTVSERVYGWYINFMCRNHPELIPNLNNKYYPSEI